MCWIPLLLAGTSLLALPLPHLGAAHALTHASVAPTHHLSQTSPPEGNLPPDRYLELRIQTMARAHLIAGPRLKNPNLANGGFDRSFVIALAEQRADRLSRLGPTAAAATDTLLSSRPASLLPSSSSPQTAQQTRSHFAHDLNSSRPVCSWPAIQAVNGRSISPVFTPVEPDNHYRITGCGFGSAPGVVRLQPSQAGSSLGNMPEPIPLQLDTLRSWTDDHIDVHLEPNLTGFPDFSADLLIQLPNGRSVQLTRCQFLAARGEPQLLRPIPAAWVRLDATSLSGRAIRQVEFESPPVPGEELPAEAIGSSAFIARSDSQAFNPGKDTYDLSQLAPGWVIESVQLRVLDAVCPGENKIPVSNGSWETTWIPRGFVITWADETCVSPIPPVFNFTLSSSQYAANVWVIGPAGTRPFPNTFTARQP